MSDATRSGSRKLSISLPESTVDRLRDRLDRGEVSGFIAEAVEEKLRREAMLDWLADAEAKRGPLAEADIAAANEPFDRALDSLVERSRRSA